MELASYSFMARLRRLSLARYNHVLPRILRASADHRMAMVVRVAVCLIAVVGFVAARPVAAQHRLDQAAGQYGSAPQGTSSTRQTPEAQAKPAPIPGFDIHALDRTVDPCTDFYRFACGTWMAQNPIPPDQSRWGRFDELQQRNRELLRSILESVSSASAKRSSLEQKIGDYYASCMDADRINALGLQPLRRELDRIAAIANRQDFIAELARLNRGGVRALFSFYPRPDLHDATRMIADVDQGGLGLPDRDYYLKTDAKSVETRERYRAHVAWMFVLSGEAGDAASSQAASVVKIETMLAQASMDRTARRDPHSRDHRMQLAELERLAPNLEFLRYFAEVKAPRFDSVNVGNPEFLRALNDAFSRFSPEEWRAYLRWHLLRSAAPMLPDAFVAERFAFYGQYLSGAQELEPRWKRCVRATDDGLGEALGRLYVERAFSPEAKRRTGEMVRAIEQSMGSDIDTLNWMTEPTKRAARQKLAKVANNLGYPDKWRDYRKLKVVRGDALGNLLRANEFDVDRDLHKIGKRVDRKEWSMTPPTVNAYYNQSRNDINFPAGILQPPFFDARMDDAVNLGAIGSVIGHELTHGFDDQGAKFDAVGNLRDWWAPSDFVEFRKRTSCFVEEYGKFMITDDLRLNGQLTLGENTADNGGVRLSYAALAKRLAAGPPAPSIDGFTPEQRFFLGYAQIWCQNQTPEAGRLRALIDPHSPGQYRVNGVVVNMSEFQQAFHCQPGQPMVSETPCRVW